MPREAYNRMPMHQHMSKSIYAYKNLCVHIVLYHWSVVLVILSHMHRINILYRVTTAGCFCSFLKFCIQSFHFFSGINPICTHIFFNLKSFLLKCPLTVKIRKKIVDQILGYINFCLKICA